jgi:HlyD family secretion protein
MDVPRKDASRKRMIRRISWGAAALIGAVSITYGVSRLQPAAPPVERATVWIDTVKRGPMLRQVHGLGTLVPEDVLWIPAVTDGRVEKIRVKPGTEVKADTIIVELSNPQAQLDMVDYEWQVKAAEASYKDLRVKLATENLTLKSNAAKVESDFVQAQLKADLEQKLGKEGLSSELNLKTTKAIANQLEHQFAIEQERLSISGESVEAQLAAQKVQIEKLKATYALKKKQVDELKVRAGTAGILQQLGAGTTTSATQSTIEEGQRVTAGTILAKIAQPWKLKAELKIAETQAKDILIGQPASIDTRNGIIEGHVSRIDPAVQNGTVTVDVRLEGKLPQGVRPDLSVDGTIELERLSDVLYVSRPVFGQPNATVALFKLDADGKDASRVQVKLGRSSVNTIEIVEGLKLGDQVILSDMSQQDAHNKIRLN